MSWQLSECLLWHLEQRFMFHIIIVHSAIIRPKFQFVQYFVPAKPMTFPISLSCALCVVLICVLILCVYHVDIMSFYSAKLLFKWMSCCICSVSSCNCELCVNVHLYLHSLTIFLISPKKNGCKHINTFFSHCFFNWLVVIFNKNTPLNRKCSSFSSLKLLLTHTVFQST